MDESGLKKHLVTMLSLVKEYARKYSGLIGLTEETGATNYKGDNTLQMDAALERILIHYIKENLPSARIYSEEIGEVTQETEVPKYLIALDPLDGSTNYKVGKGLLPHGTLIAVYNGETPTLVDDVLVAGMIEYTTGQGFVCADGKTTTLDGTPVTIPNWPVEKNTPVYLDLYHPKGYLAYADFADSLFIGHGFTGNHCLING